MILLAGRLRELLEQVLKKLRTESAGLCYLLILSRASCELCTKVLFLVCYQFVIVTLYTNGYIFGKENTTWSLDVMYISSLWHVWAPGRPGNSITSSVQVIETLNY